jgi:3-carboxy-cis,cis-muconate cycloisomerase
VTSRIANALATTDALAEVFSDATVIQAMLDVEAALARVQSALGLIPPGAGAVITKAATADAFDAADLARAARESGTIAVPLVAALTARVRTLDPATAGYVHWGATSQDVVDTAFVRLIDRACAVVAADVERLARGLRALSDRHAGDIMLGRTLLQPGPPITFGLKAAGWYAGVRRGWVSVDAARREAVVLQFGGATGTLAALGDKGLDVADALARELGLRCPAAPWHAYGDRVAAFVAACAVFGGVLGKIARDVTLLMQAEVSEARERGGASSTMPHKRNPAGCAVALATAGRLPGLAAMILSGIVQEHERSVGGWHAEWPVVADALQATGAAAAAMRDVASELVVDPGRMRANLEATGGAVLAERIVMHLGRTIGRDAAQALVKDVVARARERGAPFGDVLGTTPDIAGMISADELRALLDPAGYLGAAETFRRRLLQSASE